RQMRATGISEYRMMCPFPQSGWTAAHQADKFGRRSLMLLVADNSAVDDRADAVRRVFKRVAIEQRHVRVFSGFDRSDAVCDAEDFRRVDGNRRQGIFEFHAV